MQPRSLNSACSLCQVLSIDVVLEQQLVGGAQHHLLPRRPAVCVWTVRDPRELRLAQSSPAPEPLVVTALVLAGPHVSNTQDDQLGLAARERAAGHQAAREAQPAAEKLAVAAQGEEQVRRSGA